MVRRQWTRAAQSSAREIVTLARRWQTLKSDIIRPRHIQYSSGQGSSAKALVSAVLISLSTWSDRGGAGLPDQKYSLQHPVQSEGVGLVEMPCYQVIGITFILAILAIVDNIVTMQCDDEADTRR